MSTLNDLVGKELHITFKQPQEFGAHRVLRLTGTCTSAASPWITVNQITSLRDETGKDVTAQVNPGNSSTLLKVTLISLVVAQEK